VTASELEKTWYGN